jgi:hypothetical protein
MNRMNTAEGQEDQHVVLPLLARHPIAAPSSVAATTSLLLPIAVLALKAYVCH